MSEEQIQEAAPTGNDEELKKLLGRIEALDRKNKELLDEKRKLASVEKTLSSLPEGTDIQSLLDFKANAEQAELEKQGKYTEARGKLEEQFRERTAEKDKRIEDLESKVRELELVSPAVQALAEIVHDPNLVLNNFLPKDKIEMQDGLPVVVDGYERIPVTDWAKGKLPEYILKQPKPQGSGAPAGRTSNPDVLVNGKNPFSPETFNITEQMRIFKTDKSLYEKLKASAKR